MRSGGRYIIDKKTGAAERVEGPGIAGPSQGRKRRAPRGDGRQVQERGIAAATGTSESKKEDQS